MSKWTVKAKTSAKGDVRKVLQSPYRGKFLEIVETLKRDPYAPTHAFEKLTPPVAGKYSRRLNGQHRVVYTIDKETRLVEILSAWAHYE